MPPLALFLTLIPLALAQKYTSTTTFSFPSTATALPTGLTAASQLIGGSPIPHRFVPQNAYVSGGYLNLLVNATCPGAGEVTAAQVRTNFDVGAARVDTFAILSDVPGVCNGMFYYAADNQECDIEWLSDRNSVANINSGLGRSLQYTNQAVSSGDPTTIPGPAPVDVTTAVHNYSLTWNPSGGYTAFYLDGVLQTKITTNVPTAKMGQWMWNNWSSGNVNWTAGPPTSNAVMRIQRIVMAYNPGT